MLVPRIKTLTLAALLPVTLAACVYDDHRYGYGYNRVAVGYGGAYRANPYYGWYGDYYYPGRGAYVWNRYGDRYRWNDRQRRYWQDRRREWRRDHRGHYRENWSGYRRDWRRDRDRDRRHDNDESARRYWQDRLGRGD